MNTFCISLNKTYWFLINVTQNFYEKKETKKKGIFFIWIDKQKNFHQKLKTHF